MSSILLSLAASTTELRQGVPVRSVDSAHDKDGVEGKFMGASSECSGPVCAQPQIHHYLFPIISLIYCTNCYTTTLLCYSINM